MSKDSFKEFVRNNTSLIKYVNNNSMTWQKFYDMYELYGPNNDIWKEYLEVGTTKTIINQDMSIKDVLKVIRNIDLDKVQKNIQNVQKTISMVQDLTVKNNNVENIPLYKKFDE